MIGAPFDDQLGVRSGSAYVFTRTGTTWTEQAKLIAGDAGALNGFGYSVSVSGDTAVISTFGSAYVFTRTDTTWTEQAKLIASDGAALREGFGSSVSMSGDTAVIGAFGDDDNGPASGSAYVFTVITSEMAIGNLMYDVEALVDSGVLKTGQANGLTHPLQNAIRSLDDGRFVPACSQLQDFINEVTDKTPTPLDATNADALINGANDIRTKIGCSP